MKLSEVIMQLKQTVPLYCDNFNETISSVTITSSGNIVTVTTLTAHGLSAGSSVFVQGAKVPNRITSLTQSGGIGRLICKNNHDITMNIPLENGDSDSVTISNSSVSDYNNTFKIIDIPNSNVIDFLINPDAPINGVDGFLNEDIPIYDGCHTVLTVPTPKSLTYEIDPSLASYATNAVGNAKISTGVRITGDVSPEIAYLGYSPQKAGKCWMYVFFDGCRTSKQSTSDAEASFRAGMDLRQRLINNVAINVYIPFTNTSVGKVDAIDMAIEFRPIIMKALHQAQFTTGFSNDEIYLAYVGDNIKIPVGEERKNFLIWEYRLQGEIWTSNSDGVDEKYSRALRMFKYDTMNTDIISEVKGDLPNEKLI